MKKRIFAGIIAITMAASAIPNVLADEVNETYDEVVQAIDCNADPGIDGVTYVATGSVDDTGYYKNESGSGKYPNVGGLGSNETAYYMIEADVRFDADGGGFSVYASGNDPVGVCVRRHGTQLATQNSRTSYTDHLELSADTWYHIQLVGAHDKSKGTPLIMYVYKWNGSAKELVGSYDNINKRNEKAANFIQLEPGTSIDNISFTKLGADTLTLSTIPANTTEINAGSSVTMQYTATRNERATNIPAVEWKVYENNAEIADDSVTVSEEGVVTAADDCADKTVTVKAVSTEKGNVEGSYELTINSVNWDAEKFNSLSLSADSDYVRAGEPLALTVSAAKGADSVGLTDGDVEWKIYDETGIQEIGNKYVSVVNDELTVSENVISQNIVVRAESQSGIVRSNPLAIAVKASDAVDIGESGDGDQILLTDAGENVLNTAIASGSWDGSHYYDIKQSTSMTALDSGTNDDVIIQADISFNEEGSGIVMHNDNPRDLKLGGQLMYKDGKIGAVGSGDKFTAITNGEIGKWYHIEITARCGTGSYARAAIYKYADDGTLVNPSNADSDKADEGELNLRTVGEKNFSYIEVYKGTGIDNLRIMQLVPDEIRVSLSTETIFAGAKATVTCTVLRKGVEIPSYPSDKISWASSDRENVTITNGEIETNALMNEKTVTIRAVLTANSTIAGEAELSIIGNDMFTITGFGLAEDNDSQITELRVRKNFYYSGDVVFIVALYDTDGVLMQVAVRTMHNNTLGVGENSISIDPINLPSDFGSVKAMVWTSLGN